jgi:hypothetical protein
MMLRPAKPTYNKAMMLDRIVEVFCEVDDFCKAFLPQWEASLLGTGGPAPRGPQPGLSTSEIITLLLVHHSSSFKYLKRSPARGCAPPVHENMAKPLVTVAESIDLYDGDRREVGLEQVNQSRSRD